MTRAALHPITSHNPDVQPERPGYAVEIPCVRGYLFACAIDDQTHGLSVWSGGGVGFCRPTGPVKVWEARYAADVAAAKTGGKVTTVPRVIGEVSGGPVLTWEEMKP